MVRQMSSKSKPSIDASVRITLPLALTVVLLIAGAFTTGVRGRGYVLGHLGIEQRVLPSGSRELELGGLTPIKRPSGKPDTVRSVYTSRQFDANKVVVSVDEVLTQDGRTSYSVDPDGSSSLDYQAEDEESSDSYQPTGQHVTMDISNVDGSFLDSSERLSAAMVDLVYQSGFTLLSYHCYGFDPVGVSCIGILLESHVSFRTWPKEGAIYLDLFTCGSEPLLPLIPLMEEKFAVKRPESDSPPNVVWLHKRRGFPRAKDHNPASIDLHVAFLSNAFFRERTHIATVHTDFQEVTVFDALSPKFVAKEAHMRSLTDDGSYQSRNPELFQKDRIVYLDGVMQSRRRGEHAYHESLVHAALFAHSNPKRVAIIGGGEGATLREVLRHNTVEKVTMVEIDEGMVLASKEHVPSWNDCSDIADSTKSCFDEPRAEVFYTDAVAWFHERFYDKSNADSSSRYDVIIMDALDPSHVVAFSDVLYDNESVARSLYNGLTDDGVFIAQVGQSVDKVDAGHQMSNSWHLYMFINHLRRVGFRAIKEYDESHGNFEASWSFLVGMKDEGSKASWYSNEAEISLKMHHRLKKTVSGAYPLVFFDGSTMMGYQAPSSNGETVYCRELPKPEVCDHSRGFDAMIENLSSLQLEVKESGSNAGKFGAFTRTSIKKGSFVAIEDGVRRLLIMPFTLKIIQSMTKIESCDAWKIFTVSSNASVFVSDFYGLQANALDLGKLMFLSNLEGKKDSLVTLATSSASNKRVAGGSESTRTSLFSNVYSPYVDRNHLTLVSAVTMTAHALSADTEIDAVALALRR